MNKYVLLCAFVLITVVAAFASAEPRHYGGWDGDDSYVVERRVAAPRRSIHRYSSGGYYRRRPYYLRRLIRPSTAVDSEDRYADDRVGYRYAADREPYYNRRRYRYYDSGYDGDSDSDSDSDSGSDEVINSRVSTDDNSANNKKSLVNVDRVI